MAQEIIARGFLANQFDEMFRVMREAAELQPDQADELHLCYNARLRTFFIAKGYESDNAEHQSQENWMVRDMLVESLLSEKCIGSQMAKSFPVKSGHLKSFLTNWNVCGKPLGLRTITALNAELHLLNHEKGGDVIRKVGGEVLASVLDDVLVGVDDMAWDYAATLAQSRKGCTNAFSGLATQLRQCYLRSFNKVLLRAGAGKVPVTDKSKLLQDVLDQAQEDNVDFFRLLNGVWRHLYAPEALSKDGLEGFGRGIGEWLAERMEFNLPADMTQERKTAYKDALRLKFFDLVVEEAKKMLKATGRSGCVGDGLLDIIKRAEEKAQEAFRTFVEIAPEIDALVNEKLPEMVTDEQLEQPAVLKPALNFQGQGLQVRDFARVKLMFVGKLMSMCADDLVRNFDLGTCRDRKMLQKTVITPLSAGFEAVERAWEEAGAPIETLIRENLESAGSFRLEFQEVLQGYGDEIQRRLNELLESGDIATGDDGRGTNIERRAREIAQEIKTRCSDAILLFKSFGGKLDEAAKKLKSSDLEDEGALVHDLISKAHALLKGKTDFSPAERTDLENGLDAVVKEVERMAADKQLRKMKLQARKACRNWLQGSDFYTYINLGERLDLNALDTEVDRIVDSLDETEKQKPAAALKALKKKFPNLEVIDSFKTPNKFKQSLREVPESFFGKEGCPYVAAIDQVCRLYKTELDRQIATLVKEDFVSWALSKKKENPAEAAMKALEPVKKKLQTEIQLAGNAGGTLQLQPFEKEQVDFIRKYEGDVACSIFCKKPSRVFDLAVRDLSFCRKVFGDQNTVLLRAVERLAGVRGLSGVLFNAGESIRAALKAVCDDNYGTSEWLESEFSLLCWYKTEYAQKAESVLKNGEGASLCSNLVTLARNTLAFVARAMQNVEASKTWDKEDVDLVGKFAEGNGIITAEDVAKFVQLSEEHAKDLRVDGKVPSEEGISGKFTELLLDCRKQSYATVTSSFKGESRMFLWNRQEDEFLFGFQFVRDSLQTSGIDIFTDENLARFSSNEMQGLKNLFLLRDQMNGLMDEAFKKFVSQVNNGMIDLARLTPGRTALMFCLLQNYYTSTLYPGEGRPCGFATDDAAQILDLIDEIGLGSLADEMCSAIWAEPKKMSGYKCVDAVAKLAARVSAVFIGNHCNPNTLREYSLRVVGDENFITAEKLDKDCQTSILSGTTKDPINKYLTCEYSIFNHDWEIGETIRTLSVGMAETPSASTGQFSNKIRGLVPELIRRLLKAADSAQRADRNFTLDASKFKIEVSVLDDGSVRLAIVDGDLRLPFAGGADVLGYIAYLQEDLLGHPDTYGVGVVKEYLKANKDDREVLLTALVGATGIAAANFAGIATERLYDPLVEALGKDNGGRQTYIRQTLLAGGVPKDASYSQDVLDLMRRAETVGDPLNVALKKVSLPAEDSGKVGNPVAPQGNWQGPSLTTAEGLQSLFTDTFVTALESLKPIEDPNATLQDLAGGQNLDVNCGYGKFLKTVFANYFSRMEPVDLHGVSAAAVAAAESGGDRYAVLAAMIGAAGPVLQKLIQALPAAKFQDEGLMRIVNQVKRSLPLLPRDYLRAQLAQAIVNSKGKIQGIEVVKSLGAASVGEALLCKVRTVGQPQGRDVVVKVIRPDVRLKGLREGELIRALIKENGLKGMDSTFEEQFRGIVFEFDFTCERRNVRLGSIYSPGDYETRLELSPDGQAKVRTISVDATVPSNSSLLALTLAPGETYSQLIDHHEDDLRQKLVSDFGENTVKDWENGKGKLVAPSYQAKYEVKRWLHERYETLRNRHEALLRLSEIWLYQAVFGEGHFHADLHGGNILAKDNFLTVIDYGNVSKLRLADRQMIVSCALGDPALFYTSFLAALDDGAQRDSFKIFWNGSFGKKAQKILSMGTMADLSLRFKAIVDLLESAGVVVPGPIRGFERSVVCVVDTLESLAAAMDGVAAVFEDIDDNPVFDADGYAVKDPFEPTKKIRDTWWYKLRYAKVNEIYPGELGGKIAQPYEDRLEKLFQEQLSKARKTESANPYRTAIYGLLDTLKSMKSAGPGSITGLYDGLYRRIEDGLANGSWADEGTRRSVFAALARSAVACYANSVGDLWIWGETSKVESVEEVQDLPVPSKDKSKEDVFAKFRSLKSEKRMKTPSVFDAQFSKLFENVIGKYAKQITSVASGLNELREKFGTAFIFSATQVVKNTVDKSIAAGKMALGKALADEFREWFCDFNWQARLPGRLVHGLTRIGKKLIPVGDSALKVNVQNVSLVNGIKCTNWSTDAEKRRQFITILNGNLARYDKEVGQLPGFDKLDDGQKRMAFDLVFGYYGHLSGVFPSFQPQSMVDGDEFGEKNLTLLQDELKDMANTWKGPGNLDVGRIWELIQYFRDVALVDGKRDAESKRIQKAFNNELETIKKTVKEDVQVKARIAAATEKYNIDMQPISQSWREGIEELYRKRRIGEAKSGQFQIMV